MNDYAKKLLGKYYIVELNSLYSLLTKLSALNKDYERNEYQDLITKIQDLEEKFKFRFIRDKIAAHKDSNIDLKSYVEVWNSINKASLNEYWQIFVDHIEKVLMKYYQHEKKLYFLIRKQPLNGVIATESKGDSYVPFLDIEV